MRQTVNLMRNDLLILHVVTVGLSIISCVPPKERDLPVSRQPEESVRMEVQTPAPSRSERAVTNEQLGLQAEAQRLYEDLMAKAKRDGSVRVIVRLRMNNWKPEGDLPGPQAVEAQRDTIAHLQARFLKRMASFAVTNTKLFKYIPHVSMDVDAAGLKDLMSNPDVIGIWEDVAVPPAS